MAIIVGFLLGIFFAAALAFFITTTLLQKSNSIGDSEGTFKDFSKEKLHIISTKNWK